VQRREADELAKHWYALCQGLSTDYLRVCSRIDGTGVRVFGALACLKKIMDQVGEDAKPCEVFDMIAGSGSGGIAALMLGARLSTVYRLDSEYFAAPQALGRSHNRTSPPAFTAIIWRAYEG
jgi:patatin-like phospholipase/acyl hydrolase